MRKLSITLAFFFLCSYSFAQTVSLVFGNPSGAVPNVNQPENYLVEHTGFVLSYSRTRGGPLWVSWHLQASDLGPIDRTNAFRGDTALPATWRIKKADYNQSGYHRGHMAPSEDRSTSEEINRETFFMSNMQPQLPRLNSGTWKSLESYVQREVKENGKEAYLYAGCYGEQGRLKNKVTVPTNCWKIVVILPMGSNDRSRVTTSTRIIAVNMPNRLPIVSGWRNYRVTVDEIETATGNDFLSTLPDAIENVLEAQMDND